MSTWRERYAAQSSSAANAIACIPRGKTLFISSGAAEPAFLVNELVKQADRFVDNTIVHLLTLGPAPYVEAQYAGNFRHKAFFIGANVRKACSEGRVDYTPVFLSQIPGLMRTGRLPVDVALIQCTPPDEFGYVNLGISVDIVMAAIESASIVIAQINTNMPVVHGAGFIKMDRITHWFEHDEPIIETPPEPLDDIALEIGRNVASLIEDGSTIQMGIGQIPDATLVALRDKKDLGVWTEMFSDGVLDLIEGGNLSGRFKTIHPGKVSSSFAFGSRRLYDYLDRNPLFTFHPSDYINDPIRISQQHKMAAINSALQIDLTGQVCADSIGTRFYSGIGGQVDFIRGASMCPGGKPIIAIRSTARKGTLSRIVATLDPGAGVVTSRGDVRYVVTEFGIADLQGKSVRERALALISVAHPDFHAELMSTAKERKYVFRDQLPPRAEYPKKFERTITTRDRGQVLLRPIRITDDEKVRDLFYAVSEDGVYQRFMSVIASEAHTQQKYLQDVDYKTNMALVIEATEEGKESELVGIGQYYLDRATRWADVALQIRDEWQGQGLGTALFDHLVGVACTNQIKGFKADVLTTNTAMQHVFFKSGLPSRSKLDGNIYRLRLSLRKERKSRRSSPSIESPSR